MLPRPAICRSLVVGEAPGKRREVPVVAAEPVAAEEAPPRPVGEGGVGDFRFNIRVFFRTVRLFISRVAQNLFIYSFYCFCSFYFFS